MTGIKISQLPTIATPAFTDIFPVVQNGTTYQESFTQFKSLFAISGNNNNITSLTGLTGVIQAPTFINDDNGNPILGFSIGTTNAVNYISLLNQSTGSAPQIIATGSDTNIDLNLIAKGTGVIHVNSTSVYGMLLSTGTTYQHSAYFAFPNTTSTEVYTFPDIGGNGTVVISTKANGTESSNAVTASGTTGIITTSSLTTVGGSNYAITWTNTFISTSSIILLTIMGGTNTTENITLKATAGSGSSTLTIYNNTSATALNGTILIGYLVIP